MKIIGNRDRDVKAIWRSWKLPEPITSASEPHCNKPELRHVRNGEGTYCYSVCCNCGSKVDLRKHYFATEDASVIGAEEWMQEEDPDADEGLQEDE